MYSAEEVSEVEVHRPLHIYIPFFEELYCLPQTRVYTFLVLLNDRSVDVLCLLPFVSFKKFSVYWRCYLPTVKRITWRVVDRPRKLKINKSQYTFLFIFRLTLMDNSHVFILMLNCTQIFCEHVCVYLNGRCFMIHCPEDYYKTNTLHFSLLLPVKRLVFRK